MNENANSSARLIRRCLLNLRQTCGCGNSSDGIRGRRRDWRWIASNKPIAHNLFLGHCKKSRLQPARNQQFAHGPKTRHLYDKDEFPGHTISGNLLRNRLRLNVFGTKTALCKTLQIRVNYITCPPRKAEKARFLLTRVSCATHLPQTPQPRMKLAAKSVARRAASPSGTPSRQKSLLFIMNPFSGRRESRSNTVGSPLPWIWFLLASMTSRA